MKINIQLFSILFVIAIISCNNNKVVTNNEDYNVGSVEQINIDLTNNNICYSSTLYDTISYIKLETNPNCVIGVIDNLLFIHNKFVIVDMSVAKSIFLFDSNGKFINKIGVTGRGPQEYDSPDGVVYNKYRDEIVVWCNNLKKILTYKLDGSFVSQIKLDWYIYALSVYDKNTLLLYFNNVVQSTLSKKDAYNFLFIDLKGNIIAKQAPIDIKPDMFSGPCKNSLISYKDSTLFYFPYDNTIYTIYKDSSMVAKYFVNYGEKNIPTNLTTGKTFRDINDELKKMDVGILVKFLETDSSIYLASRYKKAGIYSIYNKNSQSVFSYEKEINDINAMFPSPIITSISNDSLIGFCEPNQFTSLKKIYNNIAGDEKKIKAIIKKKFENIPKNDLIINYSKAIDNANFHLKQADINFVNTINANDNPIIVISKLKKKIPNNPI